jgi:hypothetical protein
VVADGPGGRDLWAIPTEVSEAGSVTRDRTFVLQPEVTGQRYWLNTSRLLGANRRQREGRPPVLQSQQGA